MTVQSKHHIWETWAKKLHRWGLEEFAAWLLEATGPVNLIGAQVVYLGQPVLEPLLPAGHVQALAHILEQPEETQAFVDFLRRGWNLE